MAYFFSTNIERRIKHFAKVNELYILSEMEGRSLKLPRNKFKIVFSNGICNVWRIKK